MVKKSAIDRQKEQKITRLLVAFGAVVLFISFFVWWQQVYRDPKNVFEQMLRNSLNTKVVSRQIVQKSTGQELDQRMQINTGENPVVTAQTDITQTGQITAKITTESIGTPDIDYVRYLNIETSQMSAIDDEPLDFSALLGIWGINEAVEQSQGQLYNEAVLGVVPFGIVSPDKIDELVTRAINDVYKIDYDNVEYATRQGRDVIVYKVSINTQVYVDFLKEFSRSVGLTQLENVDSANFASSTGLNITVTVSASARNLVAISFDDTSREETFYDYRKASIVELPQESIPTRELEEKLQQVQ